MDACPDILTSPLPGFSFDEVTVRLARPDERRRWDGLCDGHHYLGFRRFVGRGLRYVVEWRGRWLAIAGWQSGAFKCQPRDRFIGWEPDIHFRRLHLIANNTRFLLLTERGVIPNLASFALSRMCRRLAADTLEHWGHEVVMAETFVSPARFSGTSYRVAGWIPVGSTKGFARSNGRYTDHHGEIKEMWLRPLRRDACRILRRPGELPPSLRLRDPVTDPNLPDPGTVYGELCRVADFRRKQGLKHSIPTVLTVCLLARLSNIRGVVPTAQYGASLSQDELRRIGAWKNPRTGRYEPPSKSTIDRVVRGVDTAELEALQRRFTSTRRRVGAALAADGKRIRGANRNGGGWHETVTLVEHGSALPVSGVSYNEEGGEIAAVANLLETVPVEGHVITLDALHACGDTVRRIVDMHGAHYMIRIKRNAPETFEMLESIDWEDKDVGTHDSGWEKGHGRIERREISAITPLSGAFDWPHIRQVYRVRRYRERLGTDGADEGQTTISYGMTSVPEDEASPERLLEWDRGHWTIENRNHWLRDTQMGEDASTTTKGSTPDNHAILNNVALAIIFTRSDMGVAEAQRHFMLNREDTFRAVLEPD